MQRTEIPKNQLNRSSPTKTEKHPKKSKTIPLSTEQPNKTQIKNTTKQQPHFQSRTPYTIENQHPNTPIPIRSKHPNTKENQIDLRKLNSKREIGKTNRGKQ
jgi:hypothetical protein